MRKICGSRKALPTSHFFPGKLHKTGARPVSGGGTADVWKVTDDQKQVLAAKVFRANQGEDDKIKVGPSLVEYYHITYFRFRGTIRRSLYGND